MSALAGVYARRGAALPVQALARMSRAMAWVGPDGEHTACTPPVAMTVRPLNVVPGAPDAQPHETADGSLVSFTGRIDNVAELWRALGNEPQRATPAGPPGARRVPALGSGGLRTARGRFRPGDLGRPRAPRGSRRGRHGCGAALLPRGNRVPLLGLALSTSPGGRRAPNGAGRRVHRQLPGQPPIAGKPFRGVSQLLGGHALVVDGDRAELCRYCVRPHAPDPLRHRRAVRRAFPPGVRRRPSPRGVQTAGRCGAS
jgi:hypothetical protein